MSSPTEIIDAEDPGDDTHLRYRYQSGYGVILLIAMQTGAKKYNTLWCEQWEDFLGETSNGLFDAFQIKSRDIGQPKWRVGDEQFQSSMRRFINLESRFPSKIEKYHFVSNMTSYESTDITRMQHSPLQLLLAVGNAKNEASLSPPFKDVVVELANKLGESRDAVFRVLKKTEFVIGPDLSSFTDVIAHTHLPQLHSCVNSKASLLTEIALKLIDSVSRASAKSIDDPLKHIMGVNVVAHPLISSKARKVSDLDIIINDSLPGRTRYPSHLFTLKVGNYQSNDGVLEQKFDRGDLGHYADTTKRRSVSAEAALLELIGNPNNGPQKCADLENIVLGVCTDAHLKASQSSNGGTFGPAMLLAVEAQLGHIATNESHRVHYQPYENLVGIAGLLTSECKVWWSVPFTLR